MNNDMNDNDYREFVEAHKWFQVFVAWGAILRHPIKVPRALMLEAIDPKYDIPTSKPLPPQSSKQDTSK